MDAVHPDDRQAVDLAYTNSVKTKNPYSIDHRLLLPGNRIKYVHEQCQTSYDKSGKPIRSVGTVQDVTDQKNTQEELNESERELNEAQRLGRIGNWKWDIATDTITWSKEYYHLFGFDPKLAPPGYEEHLKAYTPESAARLDAAVKKNTKTGESYELDLEIAKPKTTTRWITARSETLLDSKGKIIGLRGTAQDITPRILEEEKLKRTTRALRTLSCVNQELVRTNDENELLNKICEIISDEGSYKFVWIGYAENDEAKTIRVMAQAGFDPGYLESLKLSWADSKYGRRPASIAIRTGNLQNYLLKDKTDVIPKEEIKKYGYSSEVALPLRADGAIIGVIAIFSIDPTAFDDDEVKLLEELANDLSFGIKSLRLLEQHKQKEDELRQSEEKFSAAFQATPNLMAITRLSDGTILDVNEGYSQLLGYSSEESIGKTTAELSIWADPADREIFAEKLKKYGQINNFETKLRRKDGKILTVIDSARYIKLRGEACTLSVVYDITEQKAAAQRLKELSEVRSKFIEIISHQLRTPLTALNWNLETILNGQFGKLEETQQKFLQATHAASIEITRRIHDLLEAMDIEEGRVRYEIGEVNIYNIVAAVINGTENKCHLKNLSCKYTPPSSDFPAIEGDSEKIRAVVEAFVENAVVYTKDGGKLSMSLGLKGDIVRFEVVDTGIGIPEAEQHRIFTRFFRASNASAMQPDSFGLGLFTAKSFIEQHYGKIGFESKEDSGSKFWFELPLKHVAPESK